MPQIGYNPTNFIEIKRITRLPRLPLSILGPNSIYQISYFLKDLYVKDGDNGGRLAIYDTIIDITNQQTLDDIKAIFGEIFDNSQEKYRRIKLYDKVNGVIWESKRAGWVSTPLVEFLRKYDNRSFRKFF